MDDISHNQTGKPLRIAHLDFKGIQQMPEILLDRLDQFARYGYEAVLVEYEDVFPYSTETFSDQPVQIWSRSFHQEFLTRAQARGLTVIPLQQMLGHLEYALRWDSHAEFRLLQHDAATLDLTSSRAKVWIFGLLEEMIQAHPDSPYVHLGMDEAHALIEFAQTKRIDPLPLFLEYLDALCVFCEARGKMPIIWSDMLEDHLRSENLPQMLKFCDRVILACWDYTASEKPASLVRFSGRRISRSWKDHPERGGSPKLVADSEWMEDWSEEVKELMAPYRVSEASYQSLCQAAIWKQLGFRVWGTAAASPSEDGPLLSLYHRRMANLDRWREVAQEWKLEGLVVTAWARSQTCAAPGLLPDLQMPMYLYAVTGKLFDVNETAKVAKIAKNFILRVARCRESWWIESELIEALEDPHFSLPLDKIFCEMLVLMLRIQTARRGIDKAVYQSERFLCGDRMPVATWDRKLAALESASQELSRLRIQAKAYLETRYFGEALEEWFALVFDAPAEAVAELIKKIKAKKERAAVRFGKVLEKRLSSGD